MRGAKREERGTRPEAGYVADKRRDALLFSNRRVAVGKRTSPLTRADGLEAGMNSGKGCLWRPLDASSKCVRAWYDGAHERTHQGLRRRRQAVDA